MLVRISWYRAGGTQEQAHTLQNPEEPDDEGDDPHSSPSTLQLCASFPIPGIYLFLKVISKSLPARANECEGILGGENYKNTLSNVCLGFK